MVKTRKLTRRSRKAKQPAVDNSVIPNQPKRKRGRPKGSKNILKQLEPIIAAQSAPSAPTNAEMKKSKGGQRDVPLKCTKCKQDVIVSANRANLHLYTDELKKNYVCILCKCK